LGHSLVLDTLECPELHLRRYCQPWNSTLWSLCVFLTPVSGGAMVVSAACADVCDGSRSVGRDWCCCWLQFGEKKLQAGIATNLRG
jgi:hypothetical protein